MNAPRRSDTLRRHLTVRNVPQDLARGLESERRRRGTSLNKTVLHLLRQALGIDVGGTSDSGLGRLAGTWSAEELAAFEEATRPFEQVDEDLWR